MAPNLVEQKDVSLPLFTRSLLAFLPERMPNNVRRHTNLSGMAGKKTDSLTPREAEKAVVFYTGFYQEPAFIRRETGHVGQFGVNPKAICLEDPITNSCYDGQCFIENVLAIGKDQIGIRITPHNQSDAAGIPFLRFASLNDQRLIKNDDDLIIGIKYHIEGDPKNVWSGHYLLQPNDLVELFLDPISIARPMINRQLLPTKEPNIDITTQPTAEPTILGGGFTMQMNKYDAGNKRFTFIVDWVGNDINIRDIFDPESNPYRQSFSVDLIVEDDQLVLPQRKEQSLRNVLKSQELGAFSRYTVQSFVKKNGKALLNIFGLALQLHPDTTNSHGIKCQFATTGNERPKVKTYGFDFESGKKEVARWNQKDTGSNNFFYWPTKNQKRLRQVLENAYWQQPDISRRFEAVQLEMTGIIKETLESTINYLSAAQAKLTQEKKLDQIPLLHHQISHSIGMHTKQPLAEVTNLNEDLPTKLRVDTNTFTNTYSIERLLGTLLPKALSKNTWERAKAYEDNDVTIRRFELTDSTTLLHIDIEGFQLAYILNNGQPTHIHYQDNLAPATIDQLQSTIKELNRESSIPLIVVPAMIHSLREGD